MLSVCTLSTVCVMLYTLYAITSLHDVHCYIYCKYVDAIIVVQYDYLCSFIDCVFVSLSIAVVTASLIQIYFT